MGAQTGKGRFSGDASAGGAFGEQEGKGLASEGLRWEGIDVGFMGVGGKNQSSQFVRGEVSDREEVARGGDGGSVGAREHAE